MDVIRQFKKMNLWDFIELLETRCIGSGNKDDYFMYLDEIKMRRIESVSEGGNLKLRSLASLLLDEYKKEMQSNKDFSGTKDFEDFSYTVENEI